MLSVITGLPGSGKTSHVVEKILLPLSKKDWEEHAIDDEGNKVVVKRRLFTNINGLLLEHEKIDGDDLAKWHEWVKPGDLIVFDEVQKPWPLTGANKEQPKCITELETHRHYGIDMVLLTQHPMLINAAIVRLAGKHQHVRKLGNSRYATVYEWDGVSRTLLYKNAFAKSAWRRGKECEQTYRSSALHTKQARKLPTVIFGVLFAGLLLAGFGPTVYGRISERINPSPVVAKKAQDAKAPQAVPKGAPAAFAPVAVASAPAAAASAPGAPVLAQIGCIASLVACKCFDKVGEVQDKPLDYCLDKTGAVGTNAPLALPLSLREEPRPPEREDPADLDMLAFMAKRK